MFELLDESREPALAKFAGLGCTITRKNGTFPHIFRVTRLYAEARLPMTSHMLMESADGYPSAHWTCWSWSLAKLTPGEEALKIATLALVALSAAATMASTSAAQTPQSPATAINRVPPAWSGFYAGLQLGGHFTNSHVVTTGQAAVNVNDVTGGARPADAEVGRNGVFGGVQFGYGRRFRGLYIGGESDSAFGRFVSGRALTTTALNANGSLINTFGSHQRFVGTVRGSVGRPFGRILVYGTGGFAVGGIEQQVNFNGPTPANIVQFTANHAGIEPGYALGGGAEYRASRRLSYKGEYLYYRLQDETLNVAVVPGSGGGGTGYNSTLQNKGSLVRVGANYRF